MFCSIVALSFFSTASAQAQTGTCVSAENDRELLGSSLGLVYEDATIRPLVDEAIAYWEACDNYRQDFPYLVAQGRGTRTVNIRWVEGSSTSSKCGAFKGQEIVLYSHARTPSGREVPCGSLGQNLAHEIGHVLGLDHSSANDGCRRHIMSQIHVDNAWSRGVHPQECRAVGNKWTTLAERWTAEQWGRTIASPQVADRQWSDRNRGLGRRARTPGRSALTRRP